jgi:hypothetical protein
MAIRLVVAVTDSDWFALLRSQSLLKEANFWAPSDKNFRALHPHSRDSQLPSHRPGRIGEIRMR